VRRVHGERGEATFLCWFDVRVGLTSIAQLFLYQYRDLAVVAWCHYARYGISFGGSLASTRT
jgi:hypothetical protein